MKSKKQFSCLAILLVTTLLVQKATAIPVGGVLKASHTETFAIGEGFATVACEVYKYASAPHPDKYAYTYQISNEDSGIGLSFFSVGIKDGANAFNPDYDLPAGSVAPDYWDTVGTPVHGVNAIFKYTINDGSDSAVLWFMSDYESTLGSGTLFGTSSSVHYYATGSVLTPVPEPATVFLLGFGGALITLTRKKRLSRTLPPEH